MAVKPSSVVRRPQRAVLRSHDSLVRSEVAFDPWLTSWKIKYSWTLAPDDTRLLRARCYPSRLLRIQEVHVYSSAGLPLDVE
ncbi:hypothetical protein PsYK624_041150 [Phanerochaete sordida]|uniref:Uncharacterized protein n=1 Tax=Phanerochaete sordida TaxID=48140 RepID=A0A9P3LBN9_9APHY|nr:hypothetical protein PsYK624_041150 [Phanerochaete sordida]